MSDSDNIFREVEEDLRRDQLTALWDKYGIHVLIAAGALILFVGGFNIYRWYEHKQAMASGSTFFQATRAVEEKKYAEAGEALGKLAKDSSGRLPDARQAGAGGRAHEGRPQGGSARAL